MIINAAQSSVEVIGDIKEFKIGIDPKNLEFITTLLSSNLYSDPEQSFIREIVSNAWDSHVEAGTTDTPVIINFDYINRSITIRDYGTGLSPERFQEIYNNIGSSTKRESNDYIGGFGIGRFSALACSKTVFITSYYNGKAYHYIMVKDGNAITTNLVASLDTEEKNGVEVNIKDIVSFTRYENALRYIVYFPNVYLNTVGAESRSGIIKEFNSYKIRKFKSFAVSESSGSDGKLLLGNVLYPCNREMLDPISRKVYDKITTTGIAIRFEVGELEVTPNRESIIYSAKCKEIINKRLIEAHNEINTIIKNNIPHALDNLEKYHEVCNQSFYYNFFDNGVTKYRFSNYHFSYTELGIVPTYKGKDLYDYHYMINALLHSKLPNFKCYLSKGKFNNVSNYVRSAWSKYDGVITCNAKNIIIVKGVTRLTSSIKEYIKNKYSDIAIIGDFSVIDIIRIGVEGKIITDSNNPNIRYIAYELCSNIRDNAIILDVTTDADYLKYKETISESKVKKSTIQNVTFHRIITSGPYCTYQQHKTFTTFEDAIDWIKDSRRIVCILPLDTGILPRICFYFMRYRHAEIIRVAKNIFPKLIALKLPNIVVNIYDLLKTDKMLIKLHTFIKYGVIYDDRVIESIPNPLQKEISEMFKWYRSIKLHLDLVDWIKPMDIEEDPYYAYLCKEYCKYFEIFNQIKTEYDITDELYIYAIIRKLNKYRMSFDIYTKLNNNLFLQLLCKK